MRRGDLGLLTLFCAIFIFLSPICLQAKGMYVRNWIVITLRSAPDESSQAVGTASTDDLVEVLEQGVGWTRIQTKAGNEGWVLSRFLSQQPPRNLYVKQLEEKIKALQDENMRLKGLKSGPLDAGAVSPGSGQQGFGSPASVAIGDCAGLKQDYDRLFKDARERSRKMDILVAENNRLQTSERLIFTFIGALFIAIGIVIGLFVQMVRARPRKPGYRF